MWHVELPPAHLKQAIRQFVSVGPVTFVQLGRVLPQLRGTEDLALASGCILWRGLSEGGIAALRSLHAEAPSSSGRARPRSTPEPTTHRF
jgi:hypothetical protein